MNDPRGGDHKVHELKTSSRHLGKPFWESTSGSQKVGAHGNFMELG